jgi:hypothetical protein
MGQYMTPVDLSKKICDTYSFTPNDAVLEPSFGNGSFLLNLLAKFVELYVANGSSDKEAVILALENNIYGAEIDAELYKNTLESIEKTYGFIPSKHNLVNCDFFEYIAPKKFTHIIGNPPFGGSINPSLQDALDEKYGVRFGKKIKKETYSFFIVKCVECLVRDGVLDFICSDTFLTINTMAGLRNFLMQTGSSEIKTIGFFSEETSYGMVRLLFRFNRARDCIVYDSNEIKLDQIKSTPNLSWKISTDYSKYFNGKLLSDFVVCSSGMTIGNNELFIRKIEDGSIVEDKKFNFGDRVITLKEETARARLNKLSASQIKKIKLQEKNKETKRVLVVEDITPTRINIPSNDYKYYNKANSESVYASPQWVIYWKDDGDAVITFKKTGMWYLHGVGGKKFFLKRAITWALRGDNIAARHLPEGYILDSGSPVAVIKAGIKDDEHYFILAWMNTELCSKILKSVINHTKNIQGKDVEKLPYPYWVNEKDKNDVIELIKKMIEEKKNGKDVSSYFITLNSLFEYNQNNTQKPESKDAFFDFS